MSDVYQRLFPSPGHFSEADYLGFLSSRMPEDLAQQLTRDANPDLTLDKYINVSDLMRPLSHDSFATDHISGANAIFHLLGILEHTLTGYVLRIEKMRSGGDPYKQIYLASFYLSCCLRRGLSCDYYVYALLVLTNAALQTCLEGQLQVSRFIASLIPVISGASVWDATPVSMALFALSLVIANTANDVSLLAELAMLDERFTEEWTKEEESERPHPSFKAKKALQRIANEFFGSGGRLEKVAERLRPTDGGNKSS